MKNLKANWAQVVCWVVVVGALAWAGFTVYKSGLDDTDQERAIRDAKSEMQNLEGKIEGKQFPEVTQLLTPKPAMLPETPEPAAAPLENISNPPHSFFATEPTPVKSGAVKVVIDTGLNGPVVENKTVYAYIMPAHLEVFQVYDGNELVVYLPWPEDRSMMAITGFVIQRQEMRNAIANGWIPKDGTWTTLPKYMIADEVKTGAAEEAAPVGPAAPATPKPAVRPAGLMGGGATTAPATGAGGLGTTAPAASSFDLKKYQGVYVMFDKVTQNEETRYNYRVAMIGKMPASVTAREFTVDNKKTNVNPVVPKEICSDYTSGAAALKVFAPGESVVPTTTGKIQVKFVTPGEDPTKSASFIVMRGLSQSATKEVPVGEEISAELTVFNAQGKPVVGKDGILKEVVSTGLIFDHVDTDDATKKTYAVLRDSKKVEVKIEQGKTNGNLKEPEVDLVLLNKILLARAEEYKTLFKTTQDKSDAAVPVPAKPMNEVKGTLDLTPNGFYPSKEDEFTPTSPWPDVTVSPREHKVVRIPTAVKPVAPAAFVPTPPRPPPAGPAYQPSGPGGPTGPGGPNEREHVIPDMDTGGKVPDANATVR